MSHTRRNYPSTITKVYGATYGVNGDDPLLVKYDAVADEISDSPTARVSLKLTANTPRRRISSGANIIAAQVDDPCWICVRGDDNKTFLVVAEGIPFVEACPEVGP